MVPPVFPSSSVLDLLQFTTPPHAALFLKVVSSYVSKHRRIVNISYKITHAKKEINYKYLGGDVQKSLSILSFYRGQAITARLEFCKIYNGQWEVHHYICCSLFALARIKIMVASKYAQNNFYHNREVLW